MGMNFQSIAIGAPQFINLQKTEISPLISKCEIKVMYVGANRNGSSMSKEVVTEMTKTLRGNPIVGYFSKDKEDFRDHGDQMVWDGDGIHFNCLTVPYGFVAPDAEVWFQDFKETDEYGREVVRTQLMTTGFLWTGQFPECEVCLTEGRPHSMELDDKTVEGQWTIPENSSMELFIITDAIFSKLCILGQDVEPCFEGSGITAPDISASFSYEQSFKKNLFTIMQEFNKILKGGNSMDNDKNIPTNTDFTGNQVDVPAQVTPTDSSVDPTPDNSFKKTDDQDKDKKDDAQKTDNKESATDDKDSTTSKKDDKKDDDDDDKDKKTKHSLTDDKLDSIMNSFAELQQKYESLVQQNTELLDFQKNVIANKKQETVDKFTMLTAEEKAPIVAMMDKYTVDALEKELYQILGKKEFARLSNIDNSKREPIVDAPTTTFNLNDSGAPSVPAFVQAIKRTHDENKL